MLPMVGLRLGAERGRVGVWLSAAIIIAQLKMIPMAILTARVAEKRGCQMPPLPTWLARFALPSLLAIAATYLMLRLNQASSLCSLATILWLTAIRRCGEDLSAWRFLKLGLLIMPPALVLALAALIAVGG